MAASGEAAAPLGYHARYFRTQPVSTRRVLVREPWRVPVGAMHVAATAIQRWWRLACRPQLLDEDGQLTPPARGADVFAHRSRWQELPLYHVAALEIQRLARRAIPGIAARRIQRWARRLSQARAQKSMYRYFRDLCARFQAGCTPLELLRVVNPREAGLADAATSLTVMLRLGGVTFPPSLYYKVSTEAPVCDVGAFAPRQYASERLRLRQREGDAVATSEAAEDAQAALASGELRVGGSTFAVRSAGDGGGGGWYSRWENNGWRPVAVKTLEEAEADPVARATAAKRLPWHWSRLRRREDKEAARRLRKRRWLEKLYREGLASERGGEAGAAGRGGGAEAGAPVGGGGTATSRPMTASTDASWATEDLAAMDDASLREAAERSVRKRLGLAEGEALSVEAFLARVMEEDEDDEDGVDLAQEAKTDGPACPVDFSAAAWEEEAPRLLAWAEALDPDAYEAAWGMEV